MPALNENDSTLKAAPHTNCARDPNEKIPEPHAQFDIFPQNQTIRRYTYLPTGIRTAIVAYVRAPASRHIHAV